MDDTTTGTWVRAARSDDLTQLDALLDRCSRETLYRRFHGATGGPMRREVERIAAPGPLHRSWVAVGPDGAIRGTATLAWSAADGAGGTGPGRRPEVAVLVEDAWFRRGLGRALLTQLMADARDAGAEVVVAWVQGDNMRAVRFLRAVAPGARIAFDGGELAVSVPVAAPAARERWDAA
jgi:ribosomal protein S18 acetylase RimI-like enzyme